MKNQIIRTGVALRIYDEASRIPLGPRLIFIVCIHELVDVSTVLDLVASAVEKLGREISTVRPNHSAQHLVDRGFSESAGLS